MNYLLPLLSVLIGYVIALVLKPKNKTNLKLLLAFSGSFLLSLTVMHLLPEVYEVHHHGMDESLDHSAIDLSGRSFLVFNAPLPKTTIGNFEVEMAEEFFRALAYNAHKIQSVVRKLNARSCSAPWRQRKATKATSRGDAL